MVAMVVFSLLFMFPKEVFARQNIYQEVSNYWEASQAITGYVDNLIWIGNRDLYLKTVYLNYGATALNYFENTLF